MGTTAAFIKTHGITFEATRTDRNPNMEETSPGMTHWACRFGIEGQPFALSTYFSMGSALRGRPTADAVLDCLAAEAAGVENAGSFEEWADEYGYDPDSRKAERTYNTVAQEARKLKNFLDALSDDPEAGAYEELLWETERD